MSTGQTRRSRAVAVNATLPHFLYRCYDAEGVLLYIGCTSDPHTRQAEHRRGNKRGSKASRLLSRYMATFEADADPFRNRETAQAAEAAAIHREQPLFNGQGRGIPLSFVDRQIEDYEAGRPVRQWAETIYAPPCARRAS